MIFTFTFLLALAHAENIGIAKTDATSTQSCRAALMGDLAPAERKRNRPLVMKMAGVIEKRAYDLADRPRLASRSKLDHERLDLLLYNYANRALYYRGEFGLNPSAKNLMLALATRLRSLGAATAVLAYHKRRYIFLGGMFLASYAGSGYVYYLWVTSPNP